MNDSSKRAARAALQRRIARTALISGLLTGGLSVGAQAASAQAAVPPARPSRPRGPPPRSPPPRSPWRLHHRRRRPPHPHHQRHRGGRTGCALRLRAHHPQTLQVDLGDNGSADFQVDRHRFNAIRVTTGAGDDSVRIDESNGQFTRSDRTIVDGGTGHDTLVFDGAVAGRRIPPVPERSPSDAEARCRRCGARARRDRAGRCRLDRRQSLADRRRSARHRRSRASANDLASVPGGTTPGTAAAADGRERDRRRRHRSSPRAAAPRPPCTDSRPRSRSCTRTRVTA